MLRAKLGVMKVASPNLPGSPEIWTGSEEEYKLSFWKKERGMLVRRRFLHFFRINDLKKKKKD